MKLHKNIITSLLMLLLTQQSYASQSDFSNRTGKNQNSDQKRSNSIRKLETPADFLAHAQPLLDDAGKIAADFSEDSGNMFHDYQSTLSHMKNPMIGTMAAALKMQKKDKEADAFKSEATSPLYPTGFVSFIAGASLLAAALVSGDKHTLLAGSTLCFGTSFGCYYKSRFDLIALKNKIKKDMNK